MLSNITNLLVPLLGGIFLKSYDDLSDNETLIAFKNETLMEFLKGAHYICFTIMSINDPLWFIFAYTMNTLCYILDCNPYSKPYETSIFFSFGLLFIIINYNNIKLGDWYEYLILIGIFVGGIIETYIIHAEYSIFKLIIRSICILYLVILLYIFPNMSNTMRYICIYFTGYLLLSSIVQYYSLYIYKKE